LIEIVLPGNLNEFSEEARDRLIAGLSALLEVGEVKLTRAMAGSIRLHLELTPEDADKIYVAAQSGQLADLGISAARLYPSIASPPDDEQRSQLLVLLNRVEEMWVDGVLKKSLYNDALISLGKRSMDEAVEPTLEHVLEFSSQRSLLLLQDRRIATIFDATDLLLILGEPGSGKTTTLLELAANLISRAKADAKERVPVVLNLSSWKRKQSLAEWIAGELSQKYRVPIKIARSWLQNDYLVPLLDGLDQVTTTLQPDCVAAINDFIDESEPSGLVVCCRLMEYQWLPHRLKLNGAICLESLSAEEVGKYLDSAGSKLAGLRDTVNSDPVLQELAQTPLMLSIMSLACQGAYSNELAKQRGDSAEERRKQIFGLYVQQMFQRKEMTSHVFSKEKIIGWLSWFARKMREHSQSVFLVERLQPSWLASRAQRGVYGTVVALSLVLIFGLINGLVFAMSAPLPDAVKLSRSAAPLEALLFGAIAFVACWSESPLKNGVMGGSIGFLIATLLSGPIPGLLVALNQGLSFGVTSGLLFGLGVGSLNRITLVETMSFKWNQFWKRMIPGSIVGLIFGLIFGLMGVLIGANGVGIVPFVGLTVGLIFGLVNGFVGGYISRVKVGKAFPNQGIKLSWKNSLAAFLVTWLIGGLIGGIAGSIVASAGLIVEVGGGLKGGLIGGITGLILGLIFGLDFGLLVAVIVGLNRGGSAVIKHYALRLTLWLSGYTPFKFINFLDHCAKLILLKKAGGGYIFIHRTLLEYFAELAPQSTKASDGQKAKMPALG
jgi:NACHT domain